MASSFAPCPAHVHWDERCHEHQWATIVAVPGQLSEKEKKSLLSPVIASLMMMKMMMGFGWKTGMSTFRSSIQIPSCKVTGKSKASSQGKEGLNNEEACQSMGEETFTEVGKRMLNTPASA